MRDKGFFLGVVLFLGVMLAGCGAEAPRVSGSFAGRVLGSEAFIALVSNGTEVSAYVCDGTGEGVSVSEWFKGSLAGNAVDLPSRSGQARLTARFSADAVSGTVALPGGRTLAFEAAMVDGEAGLYAFKDEEVQATAGWVIIIPEAQRGAVAFGGALFHVPLDVATGTATIPELGTRRAGKVTPENVQRFFTNGWP